MYVLTQSEEMPSTPLYHYTSQSGLMGIIESRQLWATNLFYLNDSTEFQYCLELIKKRINSLHESMINEELENFLKKTLVNLNNLVNDDIGIYVFSFSENEDLLSQWRGYCPDRLGFSIGFNANDIWESIHYQDIIIAKCVYAPEEQNNLISRILDKTIKCYNENSSKLDKSDFSRRVKLTFGWDLLNVAPILKNESFHEEKEWRVISVRRISEEGISFREGTNWIIPFIKIPLASINEKINIHKIIISPTSHAELALSSVQNYIATKNVSVGKITNSHIHYRRK
jgi:hypothetical protein